MKARAIIIVVFTLLIGFLIGVLTSAQIRQTRLKQMKSFIRGQEYAGMMMEVIQPDEDQRVEIEKLMKDFEKKTREMQMQFRRDFDSVSDDFKKDLDTLLTEEQLMRVHEMEQRHREMMKRMQQDRQGRHFRDHKPMPPEPGPKREDPGFRD